MDPNPVFVIKGYGLEAFWDDMSVLITRRKAGPAGVRQVLPVAFVLHRRTCLFGGQPTLHWVEQERSCSRPRPPANTACLFCGGSPENNN